MLVSSCHSLDMSLYYDAASLFESGASREGSLKSRIFSDKYGRKSHPASIYALIAETAKHDQLLTEVIDNAGVLALEHKVRDCRRVLEANAD